LVLLGSASDSFPAARENLQRAVELFDCGRPLNDGILFEFARLARNMLVTALVILGYPSTALRKADDLLAAARRSDDPNLVANALFTNNVHRILLRDIRMVAEQADKMLSIASEHAISFYNLNAANFFRAWAVAAAGRGEEGIEELRRITADPLVTEAATARGLIQDNIRSIHREGSS
jgi:hypothetical protein